MDKKIKVAVIGAGLRSGNYFEHIPESIKPNLELIAIADPDTENRSEFEKKYGTGSEANHYDSSEQLYKNEKDIDAVVIGSPNYVHISDALPAIERKIPILLEKPVATNVEDCKKLWQSYNSNGCPPVTVGFVLRYTPFYSTVKQMVEQNKAGQVLSISADENISYWLMKMLYFGWRKWDRFSGGFMVEKCCHDFDIFNWITDSKAMRVFSTAKLSHFVSEMPADKRVPYYKNEPESFYGSAGDLPDHQSVVIEYEIYGIDGAIQGDVGLSQIVLEKPTEEDHESIVKKIPVERDASGHYGGDSIIAEHFWKTAARIPSTIKAGVKEGIEAVLIGIAAEESKKSGLPIDMQPIRREVFGS